jgi:D-inositol-3-phosphate glycosyltransferase
MDILFVRNLFRPADFGGNRYPWEITRRLARRGHRVRVVTPRPSGPLPGPLEVELRHYPVSRRTPLETFLTNALFSRIAVRGEIARARPDVIVFSSYDVAFAHHFVGRRRARIPALYIYHSSFYSDAIDRLAKKPWPLRLAHGPLDRFTGYVEEVVFRSSDVIVAVSPFSKREIETRIGSPDQRIVLVPTGVDTELFCPGDRATARARLGIAPEARVLLTVGRLAPVKRYDRAIDAVRELRADDERYVLIVAGTGPAEADLRERATPLGSGVRFAGFVDGEILVDHLRAADLVLCTSEFENWSLSILEALAAGTPVLGTPRGSIPDLLRPVGDDLVVADTEPGTMAAAVRRHLADRERLADLGRRGRDRAVGYGWEATVDAIERTLQAVARG